MNCPYCDSVNFRLRKKQPRMGYRTFYCRDCGHYYNERTGQPFNFCHYPTDVIFTVVFFRLRYKLSLRDLSEIFLLRGIEFTHETVREWEANFAPILTVKLRAKRKGKPCGKIFVDETYLKVKGQQVYLYRAVDKHGELVDVMLSKTRDLEAAERFFKQAKETLEKKPEKITTDGHDSYPKAINKVFGHTVIHRTSKYLNNYAEQSHRPIKQRYYPMRGFKSFDSAAQFCEAYEEQAAYFRTRTYRNEVIPLPRQRTLFKLHFEQVKKMFLAA